MTAANHEIAIQAAKVKRGMVHGLGSIDGNETKATDFSGCPGKLTNGNPNALRNDAWRRFGERGRLGGQR